MTIEERIEQLERTNRGWRRLACAMAVLILAVVSIAAMSKDEDELVLRKLVIQDEQGRQRIVMASKEGAAHIRSYDADAKMRIDVVTTRDGSASIEHYDANGKKRLAAGTLANEQAFVQHFDTNDKLRMVGGTTPDGKAAIQHNDANEQKRILTATLPDGSAVTAWWNYDTDGSVRMAKIIP